VFPDCGDLWLALFLMDFERICGVFVFVGGMCASVVSLSGKKKSGNDF